MVEVRPAVDGDSDAVAGLLGELGYASTPAQARERVTGFLASDRDVVLVADGLRGVVGLCSVSAVPLLAEGGGIARLTSLVVADGARRQGVGRRLVAAAEAWAIERECTSIQVSSGRRPERDDAHQLYPALGYHDTHRHHVLYAKRLTSS